MAEKEKSISKPLAFEDAYAELEQWWPNGFDDNNQRMGALHIISLRRYDTNPVEIVMKFDAIKRLGGKDDSDFYETWKKLKRDIDDLTGK